MAGRQPIASVLVAAAAWVLAQPWIILPLLALPALWSLFGNGLPQGVDSHIHLARVAALDDSLRHGTLFPRWFPELMLGHGYPVFNYYAPLAYYLVEIWHLLGASYYLAYTIASGLLILAAGGGMFLLARAVFGSRGRWATVVAAAAYMYAPYFLTNIFVRGALPEALAQALLPWVFWSARGLVCAERPRRFVLPASLSLAALVLAHNLTLLFVPLPWLAYAAILWQRRGRRAAAAGAVLLAGGLALGLSAFFWLPVLAERSYIAETSLVVARIFLHDNAWTWHKFLNTALVYPYSTATPFRLGLVQLVLALAGVVLARRRDAEWLFWVLVGLVACLGAGAWTLPIWLSNATLQAVQFPWRLLSLASLSLALSTGGLLLRLHPGRRLAPAAALILAIAILVTNGARLNWGPLFAQGGTDISAAVTAQVEVDAHTLGTSSLQEFRPRWSRDAVTLVAAADAAGFDGDFVPETGNAYDLAGTIKSERGGSLRFSQYYWPGWQVLVDGRKIQTYPSTNLGLLTVDVPAGSHRLSLRFATTPDQRIGGILTLLALALLAILAGRGLMGRGWTERLWALLPLGLLMIGVMATLWPRGQAPIAPPAEAVAGPGLRLAGYRAEEGAPARQYPYLYVYPEWLVTAAQPADWRLRWRVLDANDRVVSETASAPWYNTSAASNWPAGTLVRDAYQLPLPSGLPAGNYQLAVGLPGAAGDLIWRRLGAVNIPEPVPTGPQVPSQIVTARLGDALSLAGYDLAVRGRPGSAGQLPVAHPGESLAYTLYWQTQAPVARGYHGFVHLVDQAGRPVVQRDQLPGPIFRPAPLWDVYHLQPDWYLLTILPGTPSGLYWPSVGLYDYETRDRLAAFDDR
ncbi:MAG TPA: 6-pyruvoyl-tetrahydropterin synthase-related protein, partial [Anaerolineae bacterium]